MTDDKIREIFLANGFSIKEGQTDLKPYVYAAARALLEAALKPGEPSGYRYKYQNFMGDEVWSFELPRSHRFPAWCY